MNLRIPDDLDAQLETMADAEHVSKSDLVLRGIRLLLAQSHRQAAREGTATNVLGEDAELMERLADS